MKYVWLVALLLLLGATWKMGSPEEIERLSDLADRQAEFANLITNTIKASRPSVTGVDFDQLYIESIKADEVLKAHFKYIVHDAAADSKETTDQTLEGTSVLTSGDGGLSWQVGKTAMSGSDLVFNEGTVITPQAGKHSPDAGGTPEPELDLKQ